MMIKLGNFFFRYRNILFIFLYTLLFIPSPSLTRLHPVYTISIGLLITLSGQLIRGATIGLAYIVRGGQNRRVYADGLVTSGIFGHVRNPLYIGNILMLWGAGILANSFVFSLFVMPAFLLIYHCIVLAEENYLRQKFGTQFDDYAERVHRWLPNLKGLVFTFSSMRFNWKRWLIKEYGTQLLWLTGITLILIYKYPRVIGENSFEKNLYAGVSVLAFTVYYLVIRFMKKSGRWKQS